LSRKMIIEGADGIRKTLIEIDADNEAELERFLKENPVLFPIEELDLPGPMMVVAVQAQVPSGAVDMVGLARTGDVVILEFKTGPQNPDFRNVLAQLLDYGSHIWNMSYDRFETEVAIRFFSSERCQEPALKGKTSLIDAATDLWEGFSEEDAFEFERTLTSRLQSGAFKYAVVAQRITNEIQQTIEYLNNSMSSSRFFGVEIVKFSGEHETAYEARTVVKPVLKPSPRATTRTPGLLVSRSQLLEEIVDENYRQVIDRLLGYFDTLGLRFEWGSAGTSCRFFKSGMHVPLSIGWVYPPGRKGWFGLTDLTLGYDSAGTEITESVKNVLDNFLNGVSGIAGANRRSGGLIGYSFEPEAVIASAKEIEKSVADVVDQLNDIL